MIDELPFLRFPLYFMAMKKRVTQRGQVSVASGVRKQLHINLNTALKWRVQDTTLPADPIKAFRGSGKKGLVKQLLKDRRQDREKQDASRK
jgi:hypothetical protein